jgi:ABC-type antimicrobial peptide transport system ATPase subunit
MATAIIYGVMINGIGRHSFKIFEFKSVLNIKNPAKKPITVEIRAEKKEISMLFQNNPSCLSSSKKVLKKLYMPYRPNFV